MRLLLSVMCCVLLGLAPPSKAVNYDFQTFAADGTAKSVSGLDLSVDVTLVNDSQIRFEFHNEGTSGIIKEIGFEPGLLSGIAGFDTGDQTGVDFKIDSHTKKAEKLLGLDKVFFVKAKPSSIKNGIGPGEWLAVIFDLQPGGTFSDVINQINNSDLRIGTDVHGVPENLITVNAVPEPATAIILGFGAFLLKRIKR